MVAPHSPAAFDLDIGLLSREYEPLRELGRGGMGWVVLARHRIARHEVAIKVSAPGAFAGRESLARLQREAQVLAELRSPNIVRLYDLVGIGRGRFAIVMEYVRGRSLAEALRSEPRLPVERAHSILVDLIAALAHAHQRGIVHRDVKPANVLLNGESWVAKLCDFGIARGSQGDASVTSPEMLMGTPAYMSPEHIDGKALDPRTDIYSLGLLGWEVLAGEQPWSGLPLFDVLYRQKTAILTPIETLRPDVTPAIALALEGALAKERSLRWSAVDEMLAQLQSDEPTERLIALRAERFAFELENRPREQRLASGSLVATPTPPRPRPGVTIAGDPEAKGGASAAMGGELPATVQLPLARARGEIAPLAAVPDDGTVPVQRMKGAPLADAASMPSSPSVGKEGASGAATASPRAPSQSVQPTAETRTAASPARVGAPTAPAAKPVPAVAPATPVVERAHQKAGVAPAPGAPAGAASPPVAERVVTNGTRSDHADELVLRELRDRRVRGAAAGVLTLVIASALFVFSERALRGTATPRLVASALPSAGFPNPERPSLTLLPGVIPLPAPDSPGRGARRVSTSEVEGRRARRKASAPIDSTAILIESFIQSRIIGDERAVTEAALGAALRLEAHHRLEEGGELLDAAILAAPRQGRLYALRARMRHAAGRVRDAWTDLELARRTGAAWDVLVLQAQWVRERDGLAAARATLDETRKSALASKTPLSVERAVGVARALVALDDVPGALSVLERMEVRTGGGAFLVSDSYLGSIAGRPRFAAVLARQRSF